MEILSSPMRESASAAVLLMSCCQAVFKMGNVQSIDYKKPNLKIKLLFDPIEIHRCPIQSEANILIVVYYVYGNMYNCPCLFQILLVKELCLSVPSQFYQQIRVSKFARRMSKCVHTEIVN